MQRPDSSDIIKSQYDIKIVRKIISLYLNYMVETIFAGKPWRLPNSFGIIKITKNAYRNEKQIPYNLKRHFTGAGEEILYNPKAPGIVFRLEIDSHLMRRNRCQFRATDKLRKLIFHEAFYGDLANRIT